MSRILACCEEMGLTAMPVLAIGDSSNATGEKELLRFIKQFCPYLMVTEHNSTSECQGCGSTVQKPTARHEGPNAFARTYTDPDNDAHALGSTDSGAPDRSTGTANSTTIADATPATAPEETAAAVAVTVTAGSGGAALSWRVVRTRGDIVTVVDGQCR